MNPRRLRPGDALAGLAGTLLVVSLFLPWYSVRLGPLGHPDLTGWQAFSVIDLLLALAGAIGIALAVATSTRRTPALPVALAVIGGPAGALATVLALVRIVDQPGPDQFLDVAIGAWIGLIGAAGVATGAWWSISDERNRGVPPVPVEVRPAPPPGPEAA